MPCLWFMQRKRGRQLELPLDGRVGVGVCNGTRPANQRQAWPSHNAQAPDRDRGTSVASPSTLGNGAEETRAHQRLTTDFSPSHQRLGLLLLVRLCRLRSPLCSTAQPFLQRYPLFPRPLPFRIPLRFGRVRNPLFNTKLHPRLPTASPTSTPTTPPAMTLSDPR